MTKILTPEKEEHRKGLQIILNAEKIRAVSELSIEYMFLFAPDEEAYSKAVSDYIKKMEFAEKQLLVSLQNLGKTKPKLSERLLEDRVKMKKLQIEKTKICLKILEDEIKRTKGE